jgi:uncharacterized protein (TIGR03067 family)
MRSLLLVPLVLLLVAAEKADDDVKKMQGMWTVESMTKSGQKAPDDKIKGIEFTIKDDVISVKTPEKTETAKFKVDATKKPKTMDLMPENASKSVSFIYELNGDTLKFCWSEPAKDRPTAFDEKASGGLMVLKRKK